jgi:spermidine synthase
MSDQELTMLPPRITMRPAMSGPFPCRIFLPVLLVCFFLSGAAGLIDQVVWSKALGLIFGHTAYAVATVLAVFMAGLASGSAWLGSWSEGQARPIAIYGWIELGVAGTAALSLIGLSAVRGVYVAAYPHTGGSGTLPILLRFAGAAIVLFVPTFLMGGTLPVLIRGVVRNSSELGARVSRLYWINTSGAVAGTFAAGFLLLPALGLQRTLGVAVSLNLIAGGLALWLSRSESAAETEASSVPVNDIERVRFDRPSILYSICFAAVGATAMAYEIGWTRLLATQLGSSTYAFTLMLGTFLAGIVIGSILFEAWTRRHNTSAMTFALTQTLTALAALAFLACFTRMIEILPPILRATHQSFRGLVLGQFVVSALAMLPTAIVFGFNFPAAVLLLAGSSSGSSSSSDRGWNSSAGSSAAVGRAYAWNTLGAIVGAIVVGFWLLPRLGSFHLIAATACANLVLAFFLSASSRSNSFRRSAAIAVNVAALVATAWIGFGNYFYDPALASFNTVLYWNLYNRPLTLWENAHLVDITYFAEGLNSTISVARTDDYVSLRTNGKVDASNQDLSTQLLLGHLGALAHPPRRVLLIGFGSGMTASALAGYPELERLDIVEIEPAVVGAAPLLAQLNRDVLRDPRVHVTFDDARNFLFTTRDRYDLIVSEPSNPWIAGVATLFTREFYSAAQARLAPGGVFIQWVQAYSLYTEDLRMLLATFLSEFHGATLWHGDAPDLILMAPSPPTAEILGRAQSFYDRPRLHDDFKQLGMEDAFGVFGYYLLDDAGLRRFSAGAPANTDDLTLLEYHAPRSLLAQGLEDRNREAILQAQSDPLPHDFPPDRLEAALTSSAITSVNLQDVAGATRFMHALDNRPVTAAIAVARGRTALAASNLRDALPAFTSALKLEPDSIPAAWGLAETHRKYGYNDNARQELARILDREPRNIPALKSLVRLDMDFSLWSEAESLMRRQIAADLGLGAAGYAQLAEILLRGGRVGDGLAAIEQCLSLDPYNLHARVYLGEVYARQGNLPEARKNLEFVKQHFPEADKTIYPLLFQIDNAMGDSKAAAEAVRFGLRMFPSNEVLQRLNVPLHGH